MCSKLLVQTISATLDRTVGLITASDRIWGHRSTSEFHGTASDRKCVETLSDNTRKENTILHREHWTASVFHRVTGQLADKPTRGQSSRGLDNSRTGQLAEMLDLKFGVYNSSECNFGQITLFMRCQYSIGLE